MRSGIIYSSDQSLIETLLEVFSDIGIGIIKQADFTNFIFELQQDILDLIVYDSDTSPDSYFKHIKIIRKIKPKTPLIVISGNSENLDGGKLYEEGVFHIGQKPISKINLKEVLLASFKVLNDGAR